MREKDEASRCSICELEPVGEEYPRRVCPRCDAMAITDAARPAQAAEDGASGDNPVYIDGKQCWRHYSRDGYATMLDTDNCRDFYEFCKRNDLPHDGGR